MNILTTRHKEIIVERNLFAGIKGEYQIQVVNPDGSIEFPIGEQFHPNVITNIGLARLMTTLGGTAASPGHDTTLAMAIQFCRVGTSSTAAAATDTQLVAQTANPLPTSTIFAGSGGYGSVLTAIPTDGRVTHFLTKEFSPVVGSQTIYEIGLGWNGSNPQTDNTLFSRFVVPGGIPLSDGQVLRVKYQITIECPQYKSDGATAVSGVSGTFNANGDMKVIGVGTDAGSVANIFGQMNSSGNLPGCQLFRMVAQKNSGSTTPQLMLATQNAFPALNSYLPAPNTPLAYTSGATRITTGITGAEPVVDVLYEFGPSSPVDTVSTVNSILMTGWTGGATDLINTGATGAVLQILLDNPNQTKENTHKLLIGIRSGWKRLP